MAKMIDTSGLAYFKSRENSMVAAEYSSSETYAVGDYAYYNGVLYKCTIEITTAEAWTAGHWTAAKLTDDVSNMLGETDNLVTGVGRYRYTNGERIVSGSAYFGIKEKVPVDPGKTYIVHVYNMSWSGTLNAYCTEYSANGAYISRSSAIHISGGMIRVTVSASCYYLSVYMYQSNGITITSNSQITISRTVELPEYVPHDTAVDYVARSTYNVLSATVKTIAHRGDQMLAPKNTAPAYIEAAKHGLRIAENDLCLSEDGYYVMWHDTTFTSLGDMFDINGYEMYTDGTDFYWVLENVAYTYSNGEYTPSAQTVSNLTRCNGADYSVNSTYGGSGKTGLNLAILKRIDVGRYKDAKYKGTQILTFEEWVLLCKKLGLEMYVDRKLTYTNQIIQDVVSIAKRLGMADHTTWMIDVAADISVIRSIDANARVAILAHPTAERITAYAQYNIGRGFVFNGDATSITNSVAEQIQAALLAGFEVECYYTEIGSHSLKTNKNTINAAIEAGVTGITIDHYRIDEFYLDAM